VVGKKLAADNRRGEKNKKMQILTSGSFINLDNGEKVEQLIFTAKAIADSAVQTEGFASSEENNKRLALEIWQGAEYMTREHEQARIQNLFVGNFLERLREIAPEPVQTSNALPEIAVSPTAEVSTVETNNSKDEFLGFVTGTAENEIQEIVANDDAVAENVEPTNSVEIFTPRDEKTESVEGENFESETAESFESVASETTEAEIVEPESDNTIDSEQKTETSIAGFSQTVKTEKSAVRKITLPEKEPYRFDDCTVTATIQLLPVEAGIRRAVLSVRTHDFAPQISIVELNDALAKPENFSPALEKAFEKYKTDLPVKVMDKMKREKSAGKKQQNKTAQEAKTSLSVSNQSAENQAKPEAEATEISVEKSENNQTAMPVASQTISAQTPATTASPSKLSSKTSKPEDSAQGNLFGF